MNDLQELLTVAYADFCATHKRRRVSDTEFAKYLGVKPSSFNQWINGNRTPDLANAMLLARKLGPRVYHALGMQEIPALDDPDLLFVLQRWPGLDPDDQEEIRRICTGTSEGQRNR